jgi:hypothetical protein
MKKNRNKQRKSLPELKKVLHQDGRKLSWLSDETNINYQRLQRLVNQGYEPMLSEAAKIANTVGKPIDVLFPSEDVSKAIAAAVQWKLRERE